MVDQKNSKEQQIENLGNRLRKLRKQAGYSSAEKFAYKNDINRAQYSKYETGADLRFSSLVKVLEAMEVSLKDFFSEGFDE